MDVFFASPLVCFGSSCHLNSLIVANDNVFYSLSTWAECVMAEVIFSMKVVLSTESLIRPIGAVGSALGCYNNYVQTPIGHWFEPNIGRSSFFDLERAGKKRTD